jgi:general secretion pathway protein L
MTIAANSTLKGARLRAWSSRAIGWWLGELRATRDDLHRALIRRGRRGVTIEAGERYWLLRQGERPIGQIDVQSADAADMLRAIPSRQRRRTVVVEFPAERTLTKIVTLPAGATGQLHRVLGFEIGRHFPFPAERVYFQHRLTGQRDVMGAVAVEIVAVPREIVDDICTSLAEAGLRPTAIAVAADGDTAPLFLPVSSLGTRRDGGSTNRILAIVAGLAALGALVSWPLAQQAELGSVERELDALKPRAEMALRTQEAERLAGERTAAVNALRSERRPLVAVLDALSRGVPDGSWLLSLAVSGREVVLDGLSPSAAAMALALERSGSVTGVVFRSPITRETSGLEHFQLGATLSDVTP